MRTAPHIGLSIRQPWIELILSGEKTIEVRTWKSTHRGSLWLHAGQKIDEKVRAHYGLVADLTIGAIVGHVDVEDCFSFTEDSWNSLQSSHRNLAPFDARYCGWILRNPCRIVPIPYKGSLGLMKIPTDIVTGRSVYA